MQHRDGLFEKARGDRTNKKLTDLIATGLSRFVLMKKTFS
jgi:hypothetical protein